MRESDVTIEKKIGSILYHSEPSKHDFQFHKQETGRALSKYVGQIVFW